MGGPFKPHVLLVSTSAAPRAVPPLRLVSLGVFVSEIGHTDSSPCDWNRQGDSRRSGFKSAEAESGVGDAGSGRTPLRCSPPLSATVLQQLLCRSSSAHLTALHRRNHQDYVSIMLAARCLLFAAVCARCAATGNVISFLLFYYALINNV